MPRAKVPKVLIFEHMTVVNDGIEMTYSGGQSRILQMSAQVKRRLALHLLVAAERNDGEDDPLIGKFGPEPSSQKQC